MTIKLYRPSKQVNKKYFGEKYKGTKVLKSLERENVNGYRNFRKLSKRANRREIRSKVLEMMVFRYAA